MQIPGVRGGMLMDETDTCINTPLLSVKEDNDFTRRLPYFKEATNVRGFPESVSKVLTLTVMSSLDGAGESTVVLEGYFSLNNF